MSNFTTMAGWIAARLHEPNDSTVVKEELVAALHYYRSERPPWAHKRGTLDTVASKQQYKRGEELPADVLTIDYLAVRHTDTVRHQMKRLPLEALRESDSLAEVTGYPSEWAWGQESLWVYPPTQAGLVLEFDYHADSTRDEDTGKEITTGSDTETNEWFRRGKQLLITRAMLTYATLRGWDDAALERLLGLNSDEETRLMREANLQRGYRQQTEGYWM